MRLLLRIEKVAALIIDLALFFIAYKMSKLLLSLGWVLPSQIGFSTNAFIIMTFISIIFFLIFRVYDTPIRYIGVVDAFKLGLAMLSSYTAFALINNFLNRSVPLAILINMMMSHIFMCALYRYGIRFFYWMYGHYIAPGVMGYRHKAMYNHSTRQNLCQHHFLVFYARFGGQVNNSPAKGWPNAKIRFFI